MATKQINIHTRDMEKNESLPMDVECALICETITAMLGFDESDDADNFDFPEDSVHLPAMDKDILKLVIKYCDHKLTENKDANGNYAPSEADIQWEKDFLGDLEDKPLFELLLAANYVDNKYLLDATSQKIADIIKECKTEEDVRRRFNITKQFTEEEEEEIKEENPWCLPAP